VPREVVWLNGAPGSGKGANQNHILQTRGLEVCISLSDLLKTHPDSREIIARGDMLPDKVRVCAFVYVCVCVFVCVHMAGHPLVRFIQGVGRQ
jgi:hypothetical protein